MTEQYADLDSSKEKVIDAQYQLNQYKIQVQAKQAALKQVQAALDKAKLNLSYTEIRAPIDGMIGQSLQMWATLLAQVIHSWWLCL